MSLHGLPGGPKTIPWTVLSGSATAGARQIRVVGNVRGEWPIGSTVAIASSDYTPVHSERHIITGCESLNKLLYSTVLHGTVLYCAALYWEARDPQAF